MSTVHFLHRHRTSPNNQQPEDLPIYVELARNFRSKNFSRPHGQAAVLKEAFNDIRDKKKRGTSSPISPGNLRPVYSLKVQSEPDKTQR